MSMKNIKNFENFCLNENQGLFFKRHNMSDKYENRIKDYGLSENPSVLSKVSGFFQKMEDRLQAMSDDMSTRAKSHRTSRDGRGGEGFNTGYESLFGISTLVPNVLKKIFGPTKYEFSRKSKDDVNLEMMRHTNEDFVKNELPSIRTENQMVSHADTIYNKANVRPGEHPLVDDIVKNRANLYYERQVNPNSSVLNPNVRVSSPNKNVNNPQIAYKKTQLSNNYI